MNQRLRGVLGTALVWGAGWAAVGFALAAVRAIALRSAGVPMPMSLTRFVVLMSVEKAALGVLTGVLFALVLWGVVGRQTAWRTGKAGLSTRHAAAWGAVVGAVLPLTVVALLTVGGAAMPLAAVLTVLVTGGVFGAGTAAGTIAIAARAPATLRGSRHDPALSSPVA